jgi:hypothetical protein
MSSDKIVVLVLALLFFGGIVLLAIKNRKANSGQDQIPASAAGSKNDEDVSPFQPKEKERRKSK